MCAIPGNINRKPEVYNLIYYYYHIECLLFRRARNLGDQNNVAVVLGSIPDCQVFMSYYIKSIQTWYIRHHSYFLQNAWEDWQSISTSLYGLNEMYFSETNINKSQPKKVSSYVSGIGITIFVELRLLSVLIFQLILSCPVLFVFSKYLKGMLGLFLSCLCHLVEFFLYAIATALKGNK